MTNISISSVIDREQGRQHIFVDVVGEPIDLDSFTHAISLCLGTHDEYETIDTEYSEAD